MADSQQAGDPLRRFVPGETFVPEAATLNRWQDAARAFAEGQISATAGRGTVGQIELKVKNNGGQNRKRGDVLAIGSPVFDPTNKDHVLRARPYLNVSAVAEDYDPAVILLEPIPAGKTGSAVLMGVAWTKVDFKQSGDRFAFSKEGSQNLESSSICGNARVLWPFSGTGVKDALVVIGIEPTFCGPGVISTAWAENEATAKCKALNDTGNEIDAAPYGGISPPLDVNTPILLIYYPNGSNLLSKWYFLSLAGTAEQQVITDVVEESSQITFKKRTLLGQWKGDEEDGPALTTTDCPDQ